MIACRTKMSQKCPVHVTQATSDSPDAASSSSGAASDDKHKELVKKNVEADIKLIFSLAPQPKHQPYYSMKRGHQEYKSLVLRNITTAGPTVEDGILKAKELLKDGVNPDLMRHAFGIYLTHSADAQRRHIVIPPLKNHAMVLNQTTRTATSNTSTPTATTTTSTQTTLTITPGEVVTPDTMQGPALLSYWREDYDYNDHHIHWHMVFPGAGVYVDGKHIRVIDRQGELFLYMHSQMVTRYETEGRCWNLPLVRPWNQYDDILEYGYVPVPGLIEYYGGYPAYSRWFATKNPNIPDTKDAPVPRATLETWRDNIYQAIKDGYFWTKKETDRKKLILTEDNCADIVGTVIEAESEALQVQADGYTLDGELYGNLHNFGHDKFAEMAYRQYLSPMNPYTLMISNFGSPRDASFWPWHKHIQYFGRLSAAKFPQDITAHKAAVVLSNLSLHAQQKNSLDHHPGGVTTWMGPPAVNLLESKAKLDHEPYEWSVEIKSTRFLPPPSERNPQYITLRMFIAAKELMEDYHNWIEMDKITVKITSLLNIKFVRRDKDSSVARKMGNYSELDKEWVSTWCRCGWPQNMMLPVGKIEGMPFVVFCMATDDFVDDIHVKTPALSYCGAMQNDRKYPDPRGMGYPFNREWTQERGKDAKRRVSQIIADNTTYPFIATSTFNIFRTTKPFLDSALKPVPFGSATWFDKIKTYFLPDDVVCMLHEYGYDLSDYDDVALHSSAILDAVQHKRMPLQMDPFTQENPDPNHPFWTDEMCTNFAGWISNGCPKGKDPNPPSPPSTATWNNPIKDYFLPADVECMRDAFNLSDYEDVAKYAALIYNAVVSKKMPKQMSPYTQENPDPKHPLWTTEKCKIFKGWMDGGCKY